MDRSRLYDDRDSRPLKSPTCVCAVCVLCGARFHSGVHKIVPECLGGSKLMQGTKNSPTEIPSVRSQLLTTDQGVQ